MRIYRASKFIVVGFMLLCTSTLFSRQSFAQPNQRIRCLNEEQVGHRCFILYHPHAPILAVANDYLLIPEDHEIRLWNTETQQPVATLMQLGAYPNALEWSPDGDFLATVGSFLIHIWDVDEARIRQTINLDEYIVNVPELERPHVRFISSISWHPDGSRLAIAFDGFASILNLETNEFTILQTDNLRNSVIVAWSPDGTKLVAVNSYSLIVYESSTFEVVLDIQLPDGAFIGRADSSQIAAWSPNGQWFAIGLAINPLPNQYPGIVSAVIVYDLVNGEVKQTFVTETDGYVNAITWHPDSQLLAGAHGNWQPEVGAHLSQNLTQVWDVTTGQSVEIEEYEIRVTSISWSPDGNQLAFALTNGNVEIQDFSLH